jgi:nucleoside 2-deoxyribosyltransferase
MKLYYTASIRLNKQNSEIQDLIKEASKNLNFKFESVYSKFDKVEEYANLSDEAAFEVFRTAQKSLKEADVVVADVSHPSDRIGYEVATALAERKPVLALLHKSAKMAPPIQGNKSKYLEVARYDQTSEIKKLVADFLEQAKKMVDTKFILIISPEIDKYLEWASNTRRQHKAQIVRNAVEEVFEKDKEYKAFLNKEDMD